MVKVKKDLTGMKFGRLLVLKQTDDYINKINRKYAKWECLCDCGKIVSVIQTNLTTNGTLSCGCLLKESRFSHKLSYHKIYRVYRSMLSRCLNPKNPAYKNYGGRGIKIHKEWRENPLTFMEWCFNNGYKQDLDIDRINNEGDYEPSNCRFVTRRINNLNKRISANNTSGYVGIKKSGKNKWTAVITVKYKRIHLGTFCSKEEALNVRNTFIINNKYQYKIQEYKGENYV